MKAIRRLHRFRRFPASLICVICGICGICGWAFAGAAGPALRFWERVPPEKLPAGAVTAACGHDAECPAKAARAAWRFDLDNDANPEYLVTTGCQAAGCRFDVVRSKAGAWSSIFEPRRRALLAASPVPGEIFPRVRAGHRDFRVSDLAFKWDGEAYVPYQAADYHAIEKGWLDEIDPSSSVLLWLRDYAGRKEFDLIPRYLPGSFGDLPGGALAGRVSDSKMGTEWVAFQKGNIWADQPSKERRFFIFPPLGPAPPQMKLASEWLVVSSDGKEIARIHRRTLHVRLAQALGN
jgi:hypothetical protein